MNYVYNNGLIYKHIDIQTKNDLKIASFDLDHTLIKTKSGGTFPKSFDDWQPLYDTVKDKLQELIATDYIIVIFTNQKKLPEDNIRHFCQKIVNIMAHFDIPSDKYTYYISYLDNGFRKPMTGMFDTFIANNQIISIDKINSFYCGDAGGRVYLNKKIDKDFSINDLFFARNIKLKFKYPEEIFNKKISTYYVNDPYADLSLKIWIMNKQSIPWNEITEFSRGFGKKMIMMIGCPASGKSSLAKLITKKYNDFNYQYFNSDIQGQKMFKLFTTAVLNNSNVIVDNTNSSLINRNKYYEIASDYNVLIIYFDFPKELCYHLNSYRTQKNMLKERLPKMIYNIYYKKLDLPEVTESNYGNNIKILKITPEMIVHKIKDKSFYNFYDV